MPQWLPMKHEKELLAIGCSLPAERSPNTFPRGSEPLSSEISFQKADQLGWRK